MECLRCIHVDDIFMLTSIHEFLLHLTIRTWLGHNLVKLHVLSSRMVVFLWCFSFFTKRLAGVVVVSFANVEKSCSMAGAWSVWSYWVVSTPLNHLDWDALHLWRTLHHYVISLTWFLWHILHGKHQGGSTPFFLVDSTCRFLWEQ